MTPHGQLRPISIKTRLLYAYLTAFIATYGRAPTKPEIEAATRLTRGAIQHSLIRLELRGVIARKDGRTTSVVLTGKPLEAPQQGV